VTRTCAVLLASLLIVAAPGAAQPAPTFTTVPADKAPQQPGQPGQSASNTAQPAPGTATLRGRVFAADSGQPLRNARVSAFAPDIRETRLAVTDAEGRYEFKDVRAGRYTLSAGKGSYLGLSYGQRRPGEAGKPLEILDHQTVERVDFALPRGSVVTGRIVDEFGEPVSDVEIAVQRSQIVLGQRRLVASGQATTNDLGEFRLFGIPPGQYYLSATWRNPPPMANGDNKTTYPPTYFPGTANLAQAQRITLAVGQELTDIVMALKPIPAARVTGSTTASDGRPMTGMVGVMSATGFGFTRSTGIRPDGTFALTGVTPGEYMIRTNSSDIDAEVAVANITVTGDDITDLRLVGAPPSTSSGRIVVDPVAAASLPTLTLRPFPVDPGVIPIGISATSIRDDGTFELKSRPGRMRIDIANQPGGWAIRAVRLNGIDVTDSGIRFSSNDHVNGLEVELTNRLTTISGLVTNGRGETVKEYTTIAFSQDREQWTDTTRYQGSGRPDQDGRFKIVGLPPGDYYIVAIDMIERGQSSDPDFLETVRTKATAVSIREGDTRTVDLTLITAP
jgi:protocatechuate 3,4-dioxygenase beta subunit